MGKKILAMLLAGLMVLETGTMQVSATENQPIFEHSSTEVLESQRAEENASEESLESQRAEEDASEESLEPQRAEGNASEEALEPQGTEKDASEEALEPQGAEEDASEESLESQRAEIGESQMAEPIDQAAVSPGDGVESQIKQGDVWSERDCHSYTIGDLEEYYDLIDKSYEAYVVNIEQAQKILFSSEFKVDEAVSEEEEITTVEAAIYRLQPQNGNKLYEVGEKVWNTQVQVGYKEVKLEKEITLPKGCYGIVIENLKEDFLLDYKFETMKIVLGESQVHIGDHWKKAHFGYGYYDYFIGNKVKSELIEQGFDAYVVDLSQEKKISLSLDFALDKKYSKLKYSTIKIAVYRLDNSKDNYYKVDKKIWEKQEKVPQKGLSLKEEIALKKGCYGIVIENLQGDTKLSYNFNTKDITTYVEQISIPKKMYLKRGKTEVIPVTGVKPKGAVKDINWLSSDEEVATVNSAGKVKAKKGGNCIITARLRNDKEYYCKVYVEAPELSKKNLQMIKGETYTLKMRYAYHPVTWKSKNPKVARVDKNGKVTAKKKGTTYIWASVGKQKLQCKVVVEEPKLSKKTLKIGKGGSTELYLKGTKRKPKWSTSSKRIVTIKNGKITAKKKGKAKITASIGKIKYTCRITVEDCPLKSTSLKVAVKGRRNIETRKKEKKIKWSSSAPKIASVKNGVVVGKKKGQAVVKAKIGDVTYTCKVKVENPKINHKFITLEHNESYTLKFNDTTMKAKWSSSNSNVATVNAAGKVSGVSRGNAVITADIGGKKITCKVQVWGEWPSFSVSMVNQSEYYYIVGLFKLTNKGSKPMRICPENFVLDNGSYSAFNRNLTMISKEDVMADDPKIIPIPYMDIAPGQQEDIVFAVDGSSSYYVPSSVIRFDMLYDGERYRVSIGLQNGLTFYRY